MQTPPKVSVVIPVIDEHGSMALLIPQLADAFKEISTEIIFVDDSRDDRTAHAIAQATPQPEDGRRLAILHLHRKGNERVNGLSGAVTHGFKAARGEIIVVMDGDLQHPPTTAPELVAQVQGGLDITVASRYCKGGSNDGLSGPVRRLVSRASTYIAKLLFTWELRGITDPMTGFFAFRREILHIDRLQPRGFKILLELLARHPRASRGQVPLRFASRKAGVSKGTVTQGVEYCKQLIWLRISTIGNVS